ncbi:oxygenase MpaB family protein [Streptomyces cyaneofuscatus]|uniref:oxygenase MpaB family protein n=1 Tax=Streptomyces cyaneofuscatus TaxID=66883 RepID=UPI0036659A9A
MTMPELGPLHGHLVYRDLSRSDLAEDLSFGLKLAFFRTLAIPSISSVLCQTGALLSAPRTRASATSHLIYHIIERGFSDAQGDAAIRHVNRVHATYGLTNEDMLYVLSAFIVVPTRWIQTYGRRPLSERELAGTYVFYRELGQRMGICAIPRTYEGVAEFLDSYELVHVRANSASKKVIKATLPQMYDRVSGARGWRKLVSVVVLGPAVRQAAGMAEPTRLLRFTVHLHLSARSGRLSFKKMRPWQL